MKSPFAKFIDDLFLAIAVWLFSALIALYYVDTLYMCVIVATVVTMGVSLFFRFKDKKNRQALLDKLGADRCENHFLFNDDIYAVDYCLNALKKRYTVDADGLYLRINDTVIAPCLNEPLTLKKVVLYYSYALKSNAKTLVILSFRADKFPAGVSEKLSGLKLEIFLADKTYKLFKSLDSLPKQEKVIKKHRLSAFFTTALNPARAKAYLITMFALLFSAYFSMKSIYFIAMSAVCLALVLLCKLDAAAKIQAAVKAKNNKNQNTVNQ